MKVADVQALQGLEKCIIMLNHCTPRDGSRELVVLSSRLQITIVMCEGCGRLEDGRTA